jgi:hypothetical protein
MNSRAINDSKLISDLLCIESPIHRQSQKVLSREENQTGKEPPQG